VGGPGHADLVEVALADTGSDLRVTVTLGAVAPPSLADGEVIGLGLDLYLGAAMESDYQLFADGGSEGWTGYLQTPKGFIPYPGQLRLSGADVVFEVPWSSLGDLRQATVATFLDWSRAAVPTNVASRDDAPNVGRITFTR
jgi:hypothetical protein